MWYLCSDLCDMPWTMSAKPWTNFQKWSPHCSNWNRTNCKNDKGEVVLSKGLRSRVVRRRRFLGGVRFLTTLGVGVGLFVRPRLWMSNCIIFYIALLNWKFLLEWYNFFWNVCWNRDILLCTTISTDFNNSQVSLHWRWGVGVGSRKNCKVGVGYFTSDSATLLVTALFSVPCHRITTTYTWSLHCFFRVTT